MSASSAFESGSSSDAIRSALTSPWKAETADNSYEMGIDTFVIRDGKIAYQSFCGKIVPKG